MQHLPRRMRAHVAVVVALLVSSMMPVFVPAASAVGFQSAYVRLDRMKINTATGGLICARPATVLTEAKLLVTFPTGYTVNSTAANWTVTTTGIPGTATAWPGIGSAATAVSGQVVTFSSTDLTVGTTYCFIFGATSTLTTAASALASQQGAMETQTSGNARIDYTQFALANISDDQIVVSAVVPPTFIFTLSGNTDSFSTNLDPSGIVATAGRQVTVTTNAKGGWIAWAKDSQQGLYSASALYTVPTSGTVNGAVSTLVAGSEGYVLDVDLTTPSASGCTLAIDAEYNGTTAATGGTLSSSFQPVAACTGGTPGTSDNAVITLVEKAAIAGATPAGSDYTDIITVVGAGNF